jgi:hypothetical protein
MAVSLSKPVKDIGTNRVDYREVTGHFHVGENMPGYLPESDVYCASTLAEAIDVWEDGIRSLDVEDDGENDRIQLVFGALKDQDIHSNAYTELEKFREGRLGNHLANLFWFIHTPDQGADVNHWVSVHADDRKDCLIAQDQEG